MASLDMSLDDMIKHRWSGERSRGQGRTRRGRGRGRGGSFSGGRMTSAPRRGPLSVNARPSSYAIAKSFRRTKSFPWQRDLFEDSLRAVGLTGVENGTKLYISNLDIGVTNEDIRELFSEIGQLKRYAIHYDRNGRSSGSAEVVFARRSDAFQALKRYNNVQLDGKLMKIEIIGTNSEVPVSARVNVVGGANGRRTVVMGPGGHARGSSAAVNRGSGPGGHARGSSAAVNRGSGPGGHARGGSAAVNRGSGQRNRGGFRNVRGGSRGRGGRGRGGSGRGWKKVTDKSADDLDKDLDSYHAEAMQT